MLKRIMTVIIALSLLSFPLAADDPTEKVIDKPWLVLRAFLVSYPDMIGGVDFDPDKRDWFMTIGDARLYWAQGRLLPERLLANPERWRAYVDYLYPVDIPDPETFSEETIARLNADMLADSRSNAAAYNLAFYDLLYDGATRRKIESHIVRFDYLGVRVSVHERIVEPLKRVERKIYQLALTDPEAKAFIHSISSIEGYNWREIADAPSRSNHSWGIAIDILPKNWGKKNIYWNWVSNWNDQWMLIPIERRWMPPASVVRAFEDEGFIWGGKWLLWDNMHFEYRPELLTLQKWGHAGDLSR
ncbi:MAG TPA: M15 family metallopeptidase [Treponemataceae bacterium]|nr:M15 family metallopeptidase [Treponemataceae bacterium]HPS43498.1 M15 family metallopeptidase [Treponemataceae bacterium]